MGAAQRSEPGASGFGRTAGEAPRGQTDVRERVIVKIAREASAAAIGVPRADVAVDVAHFRGGIALRVASPLPVPDLGDTAAIRESPPILERAARLQEELSTHLADLLGREIVRINLTITGASIPERRRVR